MSFTVRFWIFSFIFLSELAIFFFLGIVVVATKMNTLYSFLLRIAGFFPEIDNAAHR